MKWRPCIVMKEQAGPGSEVFLEQLETTLARRLRKPGSKG